MEAKMPHPFDDCSVIHELGLVFGSDRVVRINIDGICALRIKLGPTAVVRPSGARLTEAEITELLTKVSHAID
jgi:hypothetical protein